METFWGHIWLIAKLYDVALKVSNEQRRWNHWNTKFSLYSLVAKIDYKLLL
jgi:hypothetical protein